jgi:PAS domain S-box-containing protein
MNKSLQKPPLSWALISVFFLVTSVILIFGSIYIKNQKNNILVTRREELNAFADLKAGQIVRWWHERLGDAIILQNNYSLVDQINTYLNSKDKNLNLQEKDAIEHLFSSILGTFDYSRALITDNSGKVRLSVPGNDSILEPFMQPLIPDVFISRNVMLTDIHQNGPERTAQLDLIVPLQKEIKSKISPVGMIIMSLDPGKILYPVVKSWPTQSRTSEILLLKREGDSIVYLNELRHLQGRPLSVKRSVSDTNLLGVRAIRGFAGVVEGVDYRNVKVLGAIKKIAGSGWYMVAKVDMKEINEQMRKEILPIFLLLVFAISAFGAVIGWTIWHQRVRFYRQKYENELEQMALRTHFDYLLKYANDIVLLMDEELSIVEANDRAIEVYQYPRNELIGKDVRLLRVPEELSLLDDTLSVLRRSGSTRYETVHRKMDGTTFPVEISARLFEIDGVKYYQSIGRDISERKRIESNLNQILERYNLATSAARLAVWDWDIQNDKLIWDERVYELFGIKDRSLPAVYNTWLKILHPADVEKANHDIEDAIKNGAKYDTEFRVIHPDGSIKYIKAYGQVVSDKNGMPVRMIGINYDITEQKTAELLLLETEQTFSGLFETVSDAIYIHKTDGIFMDVNSGAARMYGYKKEELIGKTPADVSAPGKNDLDELGRIMERVFSTGKSEQFEFWGKRKNGEHFPKEVVSNKGKYFGQEVIISTARDITQRKLYEDQLKSAKEKAEESDRLKTAFLHNISHEIRTPMNAIVGFTALLDEPDLDSDSRKQFINIIYQSTNQLLAIISDIVDISNIETNQVKLTYSEFNVNQVVKDLYEQFKLVADQQKLLLHYETRLADDRALIETDKTKLVQIISNLLNNSFKFTRQGTVQFGYNVKNSVLEFYVRDTGIGVPADKQSKIFDRFYQIESDSSRQYSGAGLGLSISKAYVEILGGQIWLESKPGIGTEFFFTIPLRD